MRGSSKHKGLPNGLALAVYRIDNAGRLKRHSSGWPTEDEMMNWGTEEVTASRKKRYAEKMPIGFMSDHHPTEGNPLTRLSG